MLKKTSGFLVAILLMALLCAVTAYAADTAAPNAADITVTNKLTGTPDTVEVSNVLAGDIVRVYGSVAGAAPIGVTVAESTNATVYISQLGTAAGNVYVTVTSGASTESTRTLKAYTIEPKSPPPLAGNIAVLNNLLGTLDTITVSGLAAGDIVRAYANSVIVTPISAAVSAGGSAVIYVNQLGTAAGIVYVTVQRPNELESIRTAANYATEFTTVLVPGAITVTNNFYTETAGTQDPGTEDTVMVTGVAVNDIITVYKASTGATTWVPPLTVAAGDIVGGAVTIEISQLGPSYGKVYVTITKPGKAESKRTAASYLAEPITSPLKATSVMVTNNFNAADTVIVSGLTADIVVKVYSSLTDTTPIGSATAAGGTATTITIAPGVLSASGGKLYVTVTSTTANESTRTMVSYIKEDSTVAPLAKNVTVVNNFNNPDTVTVSGLTAGTVVKVYSSLSGATLIGDATAVGATATVSLADDVLNAVGGRIFVTLTTTTANESVRVAVNYGKEAATTAPPAGNITTDNKYNAPDTVTVTGLSMGDIVKVYTTLQGVTPCGDAVALGNSAMVSILPGLLSVNGGKLYVSVTSTTANESPRTAVSYGKEAASTAPLVTHITVVNNYNAPDTVTITNLTVDDVVKIYSSLTGTTVIGTFTADDTTEAFTFAAGALNSGGGKIYVTVKGTGANESPRTSVTYASEKTSGPVASAVTVQNKYYLEAAGVQVDGTEDIVSVSGVEIDDIINIYKMSSGPDRWAGPVTVTAGNLVDGAVSIEIGQIGTMAGRIYVTVTKPSKTESIRTAVSYLPEPTSSAPLAINIEVVNNFSAEDTITIKGLTAGQFVSVYSSPTSLSVLASETATSSTITFTLEEGILTGTGGRVFVTVRNANELESARAQASYTSEISVAPKTGNVLVVNYPGSTFDTVTLVGLTAGDTVTVYDSATGGSPLATETVAGKATILTLTTNLPDDAGTVWVTITGAGKAESKRVAVAYQAAL